MRAVDTESFIEKSNTYDSFWMEQNLHNYFEKYKYRLKNLYNLNGDRKRGINELFKLSDKDVLFIKNYPVEYFSKEGLENGLS